MGVFAERDLNKANASSGGNYIEEPGSYECLIVGWKNITTKAKESALVVDLKILSANTDVYPVGSIRNYYLGEKNIMFDSKAKNLLVAATGLLDGLDAEKIDGENWFAVLEASIKPPLVFLRKKINVSASYDFKSDGKKKLKKNPALEDDDDFVKEYRFLKVEFSAHDETRAGTVAAEEKAKVKK
jgi:hypothetical protein